MLLLLFLLVSISMRKILTVCILLIASFIVSSCATQVSVLTNIKQARKSFVKVETWVGLCDKEKNACVPPEVFSVGSGSVVLYGNTKKVLTAAHVCDIGREMRACVCLLWSGPHLLQIARLGYRSRVPASGVPALFG